MPYLLRIDASARTEGSHSRRLGDMIEAKLLENAPSLDIRRRDLAGQPLPHIEAATIEGFYADPDRITGDLRRATALSDQLIGELKGAETLLITAPIYNFSVPSALKAWIDQIVRIHETFEFDGSAFTGLVPVQRAYLALAYGAEGYANEGPLASMNFLEPYLTSLLQFLGIAETRVFRVEGTTGDPHAIDEAFASISTRLN